jgi:DNA-binding LacI/PurR family transcriptional regulator
VGVVLDRRFLWPDEEFFMPIVRGVESAAAERGFRTLFTPADPTAPDAAEALLSQAGTVGAWILVAVTQPRFISSFMEQDNPVVLVGAGGEEAPPCDTVLNDDMGAMRAAVLHLTGLGHQSIAFIGGEPENLSALERSRGFRVHASEKLPAPGAVLWDVEERSNDVAAGRRACARLLARKKPFTSIICATDDYAWGALEELHSRGIRVPRDISVVGCDDKSLSARTDPPLTTVHIDRELMGRMAFEAAANRLGHGAFTHPLRVLVGSELTVRGSTARPAARRAASHRKH